MDYRKTNAPSNTVTHHRKGKALSRALPPLVVLCTLYWAFCLLYLLQRGKKLFVLIIKMVIFQYFP